MFRILTALLALPCLYLTVEANSSKLAWFDLENESISTTLNFSASQVDPEEAARNFIRSQKSELGYFTAYASDAYDTQDLKVRTIRQKTNATHVIFRQELDDVPVFGQTVKVHLRGDQSVVLMNGNYVNLEETGVKNLVKISEKDAVELAREDLGEAAVSSVEQGFVPTRLELLRGYRVLLVSNSGEFVYLIDAQDGRIHAKYNQIVDSPRHKGEPLKKPLSSETKPPVKLKKTGPRLPRTSPRPDSSSHGWVHSSSPKVDPELKQVDLKGLDSSGYLKGQATEVENKTAPSKAYSPSGSFFYESENTHYHEVMVYYHISELRDYLLQMGVKGLPRTSATVHFNEDDNSFYSPSKKALFFGDGGVPDSADADIILHEYGHAVMDALAGLQAGWGSQGGAMHEGFGDYVAASFFNDPEIGEWDSTAYSDLGYLRTVENSKHFPEDITRETHEDGEIWAGTLWDLRKLLGKQIADPLIYHSLDFLPVDANFKDGLVAILSVDQTRYRSKYKKAILKTFKTRGIELEVPKEDQNKKARFENLYEE
jgi:Zn-dependent metalloprotease